MARKDRQAVSKGLDQIFGASGSDILQNVIQNDRDRGGRNSIPDATSSEVTNATDNEPSSEVVQTASSEVGSATSSYIAKKRSSAATNATNSEVASATSSGVGAATKPLSVEMAILDLLEKPYSVNPLEGPFTVSTLKIPTVISERLGWVSSLTGRPKQEIVAEALKLYFETFSNNKKQENKG